MIAERMRALFGAGRTRAEPEVTRRIREWLYRALKCGEEVRFSISEIVCNDPGCVGTETVALVMVPGEKTRALKILKPMDEVTELDVLLAVADADKA